MENSLETSGKNLGRISEVTFERIPGGTSRPIFEGMLRETSEKILAK